MRPRCYAARAMSRAFPEGAVIIPHAAPITPLREIRTTLLGSSLAILRERGLVERYYQKLEPEHHAAMRELIIGVWVPAELAVAHYRAMNQLEFGTQEQYDLGRTYTLRIQKSFLGTMFRLAGAGATPFTALE